MKFLTNEKLTIVGAAGMIGSNMVQTAIMMGLTPNICAYDPYAPALEGVAEEMYHCGFEGVNLTYTSDIRKALDGAGYVVSSGGAARKAGMTREDLLKGNAEIAAQFGKDLRNYCPDVKHVVVVFNPADITGLITLLYSGLKPSQVSTLAALDSTRLQIALAQHFGIAQDRVTGSRTYGGHGEQMAVFASTAKVDGKPLTELIGTAALTDEQWAALRIRTNCTACIGQVGNLEHENVQIGKAGRKRHMGWRPTVRGSVMNPCDHPHGGGEGKSPIGRPGPVTPWGKPALGYKTRKNHKASDKFIVKRRGGK